MADELNFQIPQQGFDSYLYGIIPDDQAVLAGAFSISMQQIRNIEKVNVEDFAKVAFNIESTTDLPLTGGTDIPTDTPLSTAAKIKTALGSGVYGTFTMSNFFGAMSGLPYPWQNIYENIVQLETATLRTIYQNLYLAVKWEQAGPLSCSYSDDGFGNYTLTGVSLSDSARGGGYGRENALAPTVSVSGGSVTLSIGQDPNDLSTYGKVYVQSWSSAGTTGSPTYSVTIPIPPDNGTSGWPGMNTVVQQYIDDANDEIQAITTSSAENFQKSKILNTLWNISGIALKHEQRARYIAAAPVPVPYDNRVANYPTSMYAFVDSIPDYAKETLPHMAAQTLEHISDLMTTGGQSIVAMMRQERNQDRLGLIGIELDNNLNNSLDTELQKQLTTNGTLCGAVEGIESPNGCVYTLPAWPNNTDPYTYYDCDINASRIIEDTIAGSIAPLIDGDACPIVNPEVPIGPAPIYNLEVFILDENNPEVIDTSGDPEVLNNPQILVIPNFSRPSPIPPNLDTAFTGTTLSPSTYSVPDAIDKVVECNCDCWIN